jgi:hypothetical protein
MTGNHVIDIIIAIQSAVYALMTLVGLVAPKGSKIGVIAAKVGSDIKGQTKTNAPEALKKLLEAAWEQSKDLPPSQVAYGILHYLGGAAKMTPEEMVSYAEKMGIEEGLQVR